MNRSDSRPVPVRLVSMTLIALFITGIAIATIGLIGATRPSGLRSRGTVPATALPNSGRLSANAAVLAGPVSPSTRVPVSPTPGPRSAAGPPVRVRVRSIGVDARVEPVSADQSGALAVPDDPGVLGWWRLGAMPASGRGTVVIDGHVDSAGYGPGALFRLSRVRLGDTIRLDTAVWTIDYTVRAVRSYRKASLPPEVFDPTGAPRLVLISCGGQFDRTSLQYTDNVVVYAVPT